MIDFSFVKKILMRFHNVKMKPKNVSFWVKPPISGQEGLKNECREWLCLPRSSKKVKKK